MGRSCAFVRLGGCNLTCSWCDTPYTWDWTGQSEEGIAYDPKTELHAMDVAEVVEQLRAMTVDLIVISGGEPLQQQPTLIRLCGLLREAGLAVEIETNGTLAPTPELVATGVRFNVSPKLRHSGVDAAKAIVPESLQALNRTPDVAFKFVCRDLGDLAQIDELVERLGLAPIWVMPEGKDVESLDRHLSVLADAVVERRWNMTTRIHVQAWGKRRGV